MSSNEHSLKNSQRALEILASLNDLNTGKTMVSLGSVSAYKAKDEPTLSAVEKRACTLLGEKNGSMVFAMGRASGQTPEEIEEFCVQAQKQIGRMLVSLFKEATEG